MTDVAKAENKILRHAATGLLVAVFAVLALRSAWVCDDAYITFRSIDNFVNGYGPRFNVVERVQAYTHPLWMLANSAIYAVTREPYYSALALSLVCSALTIGLYAARIAPRTSAVVAGGVALALSKAFVDYSTSGLENPLTHLLLVLFVLAAARESPGRWTATLLGLLAALLTLNRPDAILLVLPALVMWGWFTRRRAAATLAGFAPLIAWGAFSVFYYGRVLPNTAYAKLSTGIARSDYLWQGLKYFQDGLLYDPLTVSVIALALVAAVFDRRRRSLALAAGIVLQLLYVLWVGGDFMSGRLFSAPFLMAVIVLATRRQADWQNMALVGACVVVGLLNPKSPVYSGAGYEDNSAEQIERTGIADERGYYYPYLGLLRALDGYGPDAHPWAISGAGARRKRVDLALAHVIGMLGYYAGPEVYVIDRNALCDPLLIMLPARRDVKRRIGHMQRALPEGYSDSLRADANLLTDPAVAVIYDDVRLVTRGPLWSWERLKAIVALNLGRGRSAIDAHRYQYPPQ